MKSVLDKNRILAITFVVALTILIAIGWSNCALRPSTVKIYFFKDETIKEIIRPLPEKENPANIAIAELLKGPSQEEKQAGLFSQIPANVRLIDLTIKNHTATINLAKEISTYGGGISNVQGMIAQIVYTLTALPNIDKVKVLVEGKSDAPLGSEGFIIDRDLSRKDLNF